MRIIKEFKLNPEIKQDILIGKSTIILSVLFTIGGLSLFAEVDDNEQCLDKVGIFIIPSNDSVLEDIPEYYTFFNTIQVIQDGGYKILHVYIQGIDFDSILE